MDFYNYYFAANFVTIVHPSSTTWVSFLEQSSFRSFCSFKRAKLCGETDFQFIRDLFSKICFGSLSSNNHNFLKKLPTNIFRTDLIKNDVVNMITTLFKKCLTATLFKKGLTENPSNFEF